MYYYFCTQCLYTLSSKTYNACHIDNIKFKQYQINSVPSRNVSQSSILITILSSAVVVSGADILALHGTLFANLFHQHK